MTTIDFYWDFGSPNVYIAEKILEGIAERTGATVAHHPILLGGLFKMTSNQPPMLAFKDVQGKTAYMQQQMARFLKRYDLPFNWNPHFPVITTALMRGATFAQGKDWEQAYKDTVYRAIWVDQVNMTDPEIAGETLAAAGLPATDIMAAAQDQAIKDQLFAATEAAAKRGAFGAPACFVGDQQFFGKDTLDDLEWYITTLA